MSENNAEFVVAIGASAGGLQSLERFFDRVKTPIGAAYIVVQHLSPNYETMMDKLLSRHTAMPVDIAKDQQVLEADHVYVIPPRQDMVVEEGRIHLSEQSADEVPHLPIDRLFNSVGKHYREKSIAVVLSGTGSDGSRGIQEIRKARGLVLCESEVTAKFSGMPRSAQSTGCVDHVLPAESMARMIVRRIVGTDQHPPSDDGEMGTILSLLKDRMQVDFSQYKPATVTRRIERRMGLCNVSTLGAFADLLRSDPPELDNLYQDMLIGVTKFFRDPACFEYFEQEIAPSILRNADPDAGVRVWCPGCATGEEPFSIAMVLHEQARLLKRPLDIKIFASDVHPDSLRTGSVSTYSEAAVQHVSKERLGTHFEVVGNDYRIRKHIRQLVVFAPHNLLQEPPFTSLDLVSCRNLLIYFDHAAQNRALTLFHFGLRQNGVLFLGPSETVGELNNEFRVIHDRFRFYRKVRESRLPEDANFPMSLKPRARPFQQKVSPGLATPASRHQLYDLLLDQVLPPTLLIDEDRHVVEMYGGAERFLVLRGRRLSTDVLDICPEPLQGALTVGFRRLENAEGQTIRLPNTKISLPSGEDAFVSISLRNIVCSRSATRFTAITFTAMGAETDAHDSSANDDELLEMKSGGPELPQRIRELENDLATTQENLQATIEELEASNEELQATNEELVSSNEELQSSNEELNSVNEELHTVNVEYQSKNAELRELNEDMNHLLASTEIGTIFLDCSLCIRRYTPHVTRLFALEPQDLGRPLSAFSHSLVFDNLQSHLSQVLETGVAYEREVESGEGTPYFLRILPYVVQEEISGVTITLTNIETLVRFRKQANRYQRRLQKAIDAVPVFVSFVNRKRCYEYVNRAYSEVFGIPTDDVMGMPVREVLGEEAYRLSEHRITAALNGEAQHFETTIEANSRVLSVIADYRPEIDADGKVLGFYVSASDVSSLKQAERELEAAVQSAKLANEAKSEFLAKMSHEIRSPMSAILGFAELLSKQVSEPDDRNCIEVIRSNGEHLLSLINDLLDLSQIEMRRVELASELVNVEEVLSRAFNTLLPRATENRVEMLARLDTTVSSGMRTDGRRLTQVIINLLTNAIKFCDGGRAMLSARRSARTQELLIYVADSGCGIDLKDLERLFEPFTQVDSSSERQHEGSGLGLTITKQLVEQMGGSVRVRSALDRGSVFHVRLPWSKVLPVQVKQSAPPLESQLPRLDGVRILVIDDRRDMRFIAEQILADVGADVVCAAGGEQGLAAFDNARESASPFCCVVTDIQMPGMDGYAVARALRDREFAGPVVALTANAMASDRQKTIDAGCDGFISKPIDRVKFVRQIAGMTNRDASIR